MKRQWISHQCLLRFETVNANFEEASDGTICIAHRLRCVAPVWHQQCDGIQYDLRKHLDGGNFIVYKRTVEVI